MGLLKKANDNKIILADIKTQTSSSGTIAKKKNQIEELLTYLFNTNTGFDYSRILFETLSDYFKFSKGVLLFLEQDLKLFQPIISSNIDITTSRHLRIPDNIFNINFNNYNQIIKVPDKKIKFLKQYFSIREFSAMNSIILIPFYLRGILHTILLIIDPLENIVSDLSEISLKSDKIVKNLIKSRKPFNYSKDYIQIKPNKEPQSILQEYIDKNVIKDITFLIIKLNISLIRDKLVSLLPDTDPFNITNDIIKSITKLISPTGILINISNEEYMLFYKIKTGKSIGLILHQINLAISSFFNLSITLPKIETLIKSVPDNLIDNAEILLEDIL